MLPAYLGAHLGPEAAAGPQAFPLPLTEQEEEMLRAEGELLRDVLASWQGLSLPVPAGPTPCAPGSLPLLLVCCQGRGQVGTEVAQYLMATMSTSLCSSLQSPPGLWQSAAVVSRLSLGWLSWGV